MIFKILRTTYLLNYLSNWPQKYPVQITFQHRSHKFRFAHLSSRMNFSDYSVSSQRLQSFLPPMIKFCHSFYRKNIVWLFKQQGGGDGKFLSFYFFVFYYSKHSEENSTLLIGLVPCHNGGRRLGLSSKITKAHSYSYAELETT